MLPDLEQELQDLRTHDLFRAPLEIESAQGPRVVIDGKERLLFCSNNYLGLANHPALKDLARVALDTFGCGTAASRLISGNMSIHKELETRLARFLGTDSALSFPTGYMANLGVIPVLVGPKDIIFSDQLNHRSIIDGCRLSRAKTVVYRHCDTDHLAELLSTETDYRRKLIVTDGLFSMDGDLAPLPELVTLSRDHNTILMVDDAHGTGVLGPGGRGIHEHFGITEGIDVLMTAGSKALGTFGGFIAGSRALTDLLINRSPSFIYTTALSPDTCSATLAALDLVEEDPSYRERLLSNVNTVTRELTSLGFDIMNSRSQIIPVLVGDAGRTMDISRRLFDQGIFLSGIRPPTVPQGESRLRLTLMSNHSEDDISRLLEAMAGVRDNWV
ncbi:MAG: 8-amino-7-oxononanoate synthase [Gemmatimonadetes bacterium]|nr:8-amino-7-oxononanoate synthase [Gemmatimonadota bacterium]|tara:strand:+ start:1880 stop:3043 length:1164 start_codon:yes stop_codon:yes gene_type:complete